MKQTEFLGIKPIIGVKDICSEKGKALLKEIKQRLTNEILR